MPFRLKVLSPSRPIMCHCSECKKVILSGEAAIQIIDMDAKDESDEVMLLIAEKGVLCCGTMKSVPEVFQSVREALDLIDTIEESISNGDQPYIEAYSVVLQP